MCKAAPPALVILHQSMIIGNGLVFKLSVAVQRAGSARRTYTQDHHTMMTSTSLRENAFVTVLFVC